MSRKVLRVGDPHVQVSNIKDSQKLMDFIIKTAIERNVKIVEFLGDLFHTHAVKRIEVEHFWMDTFNRLDEHDIYCNVLVGNHYQPGSKEKEQQMNALNIFTPGPHSLSERKIISEPTANLQIKTAYIPYHSDHEAFIKAAHDLYNKGATSLLVAHQTFTGAQYENGFFSEEGIDPALIPQTQIISGHIHKSQQVGKCFYPGTPKWDTMSDANQAKGIWIFTHDDTGMYVDKEFISTEDIVTPIVSYEIKEGDEIPELNPKARNYVVLEGQSAWINKIKKKMKDLAHIKVKPTDRVTRPNRENSATLEKYLETEFQPISGVTKEELKDFIQCL
jgi:DNA repair exonuclease SbcCD nuclease subunit